MLGQGFPQIQKLADRSDVISESQNAPKSQFSGTTPRTPLGKLTTLPQTPNSWGGGSLPLTRIPPPLSAARPFRASFLRVSGSNQLQSWQPYYWQISNAGQYEVRIFFRFQRTDKMDSVMKGLMGQCPAPRIFGLETPLYLPLQFLQKAKNKKWQSSAGVWNFELSES